jgi:3-oxoacyl-[acyl-carrier-protein] synthase II
MERVAVTGIGAVTALGHNANDTFEALIHGTSGVDEIRSFDASNHATKIAAEVKGMELTDVFDRKESRKHDRYSMFAHVAADEAFKCSGLEAGKFIPERAGVYLGSGIGGIKTIEDTCESFGKRGSRGVSAFFVSNLIGNGAGGNLAIRFGFRGTNFGIVSACATGTHCIGEGFKLIANGEMDVMLVGGAEAAITPITIAGFSNMKAMTKNNENPKTASRPFDRDRDGFVMGEGAGVLILENYDKAVARGATILAEVVGYGSTCDAHHITAIAPEGEGIGRAAGIALEMAGIKKEQIQYINAHGTSTPIGDVYETQFIKNFFGEHAYKLCVSSTKSMVGHLLGAAGGVEGVVCVKSLLEQKVHATLNLENPDEQCDLDYVQGSSRELDVDYILKTSMGFGGHNAALIFKKA